MKYLKIVLFASIIFSVTTSCFEDIDDNAISASEISDFVWKGMNAVYLYKDEIPELANGRFSTNEEYINYLNSFSGSEELFESVIFERQAIDRFSVLVNDYIALEQLFSGTTVSNGMEFGLAFVPNGNNTVFGYVRYVLPNTSAETQGLQRGDIFTEVDGVALFFNSSGDNNLGLLNPDNYTITLGNYDNNDTLETTDDDTVTTSTQTVSLSKTPYTENPILTTNIINVDGNNVGYLMYNGFTGTDAFDSQLNTVFGDFQSAGITDLVLDLRYNPGGSVRTTTWLASMITGQFTNEIFIKEEWNSEIQANSLTNNPDALNNPFVTTMIKTNTGGDVTFQEAVNHVNLNRVYILATGSSASASELIINGLKPYVDVVQIGTTTEGKYQASITLYDSPDFGRQNANPNHTYAMQPLVFKSLNVNGVTDYFNGLDPDIVLPENFGNLGVFGDVNEPLLAAAIANIQGTGRLIYNTEALETVKDSKDFIPFSKGMYSEKKLPEYLDLRLND